MCKTQHIQFYIQQGYLYIKLSKHRGMPWHEMMMVLWPNIVCLLDQKNTTRFYTIIIGYDNFLTKKNIFSPN